jgi:hypothetical protein
VCGTRRDSQLSMNEEPHLSSEKVWRSPLASPMTRYLLWEDIILNKCIICDILTWRMNNLREIAQRKPFVVSVDVKYCRSPFEERYIFQCSWGRGVTK